MVVSQSDHFLARHDVTEEAVSATSSVTDPPDFVRLALGSHLTLAILVAIFFGLRVWCRVRARTVVEWDNAFLCLAIAFFYIDVSSSLAVVLAGNTFQIAEELGQPVRTNYRYQLTDRWTVSQIYRSPATILPDGHYRMLCLCFANIERLRYCMNGSTGRHSH